MEKHKGFHKIIYEKDKINDVFLVKGFFEDKNEPILIATLKENGYLQWNDYDTFFDYLFYRKSLNKFKIFRVLNEIKKEQLKEKQKTKHFIELLKTL